MNNLRTILSSHPKKQKIFGLLIMIAGIAGFMGSMSYFGLFGKQIEYDGNSLSKDIIAFSFLSLGWGGVGYASGGKQAGFWYAIRCEVVLMAAGVLGYLIRESFK